MMPLPPLWVLFVDGPCHIEYQKGVNTERKSNKNDNKSWCHSLLMPKIILNTHYYDCFVALYVQFLCTWYSWKNQNTLPLNAPYIYLIYIILPELTQNSVNWCTSIVWYYQRGYTASAGLIHWCTSISSSILQQLLYLKKSIYLQASVVTKG